VNPSHHYVRTLLLAVAGLGLLLGLYTGLGNAIHYLGEGGHTLWGVLTLLGALCPVVVLAVAGVIMARRLLAMRQAAGGLDLGNIAGMLQDLRGQTPNDGGQADHLLDMAGSLLKQAQPKGRP
jgi:hypothetical protein